DADRYPYKPRGYGSPSATGDGHGSTFGIFMNDDLDPDALLAVAPLARAHNAKRVALLTSRLLEGVVAACFERDESLARGVADIELMVVSPRHAFWGGNIVVGDLYLCSDYIACL